MKRKTKQTVAIRCALMLTAGLSSSALATPIFGDINSQNRISFAGLDNEPGNEDDVLFDAQDFKVIDERIQNNISIMNDNIEYKGGTVTDNMVDSINSIPTDLGTEYIQAMGEIRYTYHHHTLTDENLDDYSPTGGSIADNYLSSTKTGCFQNPKYHQHTESCYCHGNLVVTDTFEGGYWTDGTSAQWGTVEFRCTGCGRTGCYVGHYNYVNGWSNGQTICNHYGAYPRMWYDTHQGGTSNTLRCGKTNSTIDGYTCDKREGQIVGADIIID